MTEFTRKKVKLSPEKRLKRYIDVRQQENAAREELSKTAKKMNLIKLDNPDDENSDGVIVNVIVCHDDYPVPEGHILVDACQFSCPGGRVENRKPVKGKMEA